MPLREELPPMLRLAVPIVFSDLGWMSMGIVDTMMVGRITPDTAIAIGAVSIGSILFSTFAMTGAGLLLGLDTLVSQSFGAGLRDDCHRSLLNSLYFLVPVTPLLMAGIWWCVPLFRLFGYEPALLREITRLVHALIWGMPPLLIYFAVRRYLQAIDRPRPVLFALITANLVNFAGNWILIYGHLGVPAWGIVGSAWSTFAARVYLAAILVGYTLYHEWPWRLPLRPDPARIRQLFRLGYPAAGQITFEITVFSAVGALIGKLGGVPIAAHQIALNTVSLTYCIPLGIGSAAAVRVGQGLGRGDSQAASRSGWTAIVLGSGFMFCCGVLLLLFPRAIGRLYTTDAAVIAATVPLLATAAAFQLFDGMQTCATGALRGAGDTRTPMLCHLAAYWVVGLPLGFFLCFHSGWGATGMWIGLCAALILIGLVLLWAWRWKVAEMRRLAPIPQNERFVAKS
jgi:MATE family multidrug resistance protein